MQKKKRTIQHTKRSTSDAVARASDAFLLKSPISNLKSQFFYLVSLLFLISNLISLISATPAHAGAISKPTNNLGLVGYWSFNEATGTVATDLSGNNFNGTLTSGATWGEGRHGGGVVLDGTNDHVLIQNSNTASNALKPALPVTISAWVNLDSLGLNQFIFYNNFREDFYSGVMMQFNSTNNLRCQYGSNGSIGSATRRTFNATGLAVTSGRWYHVVCVIRGATNMTAYVDGVSISGSYDGTGGSLAYSTDSGAIGVGDVSGSGGNVYLDGKIDEVRFFNRELSASEIEALYRSGQATLARSRAVISDGLVGWWTFDAPTVDWTTGRVSDQSGSGVYGTTTITMNSTTTPTFGIGGQAFNFDGVDDVVDLSGNFSSAVSGPRTISAWVMRTSGTNSKIAFVTKYTAFRYANAIASLATWRGVYRNSGGATAYLDTGVSVVFNEWTHVTVVQDATNVDVYVNGVYKVGATDAQWTTTINGTNKNAMIGGGRDNNGLPLDFWPGKIDDVRIYDRVLSAQEIQILYNGTKPAVAGKTTANVGTLADGLVGHWSFDGSAVNWTTGRVSDISGNSNHGTTTNMSATATPAVGKIGQAFNFDGVDDYVDMGSLGLTAWPVTFSAWIKSSVPTEDVGNIIVGLYNTGSASTMKSIAVRNGVLTLSNNNTLRQAGTIIINNDEWHHVVGVFAANNLRQLYVDGVLDATFTDTSADTSFATVNTSSIGRNSDSTPGQYYKGNIDDVRIYNRALAAEEVTKLYNLGR